MDIKLKNNNRNNGAGNNNVSANNDASSNSGASRNNGAGNSSNNSNAVNSSKRIIIAIAGIIFITIITMCFSRWCTGRLRDRKSSRGRR